MVGTNGSELTTFSKLRNQTFPTQAPVDERAGRSAEPIELILSDALQTRCSYGQNTDVGGVGINTRGCQERRKAADVSILEVRLIEDLIHTAAAKEKILGGFGAGPIESLD